MHHTNKYSRHSSILWSVWLNDGVFVYELSGCGFESSCRHLSHREVTFVKSKNDLGEIFHVYP